MSKLWQRPKLVIPVAEPPAIVTETPATGEVPAVPSVPERPLPNQPPAAFTAPHPEATMTADNPVVYAGGSQPFSLQEVPRVPTVPPRAESPSPVESATGPVQLILDRVVPGCHPIVLILNSLSEPTTYHIPTRQPVAAPSAAVVFRPPERK